MALLTRIVRPGPRRGRVGAATPENPRFSLNDPGAWEAFYAGTPSPAGVNVNRQSALTLPAWWRGVHLVANTIAKVPLIVSKIKGDKSLPDPEHPAYHLLQYQTSGDRPELTAYRWKQAMMGHVLTKGNGYSYIFRNGDGSPNELVLMEPDLITPVRVNGRLWYIYDIQGENRKIPAEDMLHWAGLGWDGLQGYDVLTYAREGLGVGIATLRYAGSFFGNFARMGMVITVPGKMNDKAKEALVKGFDRFHKGLENSHKTGILDGGAKAEPMTVSPENSQLIEQRAFSLRDIANFLGVPPHKLGDDSRTAFNSLEQENQSYLDDGIDPWFCTIEADARLKLLTVEEQKTETHKIEFDRKNLIRASITDQTNYWRTALGGRPWAVPDEARLAFDMNPVGGDAGQFKDPLNVGQGGQHNEPKDPTGPRPGNPKNNDTQSRPAELRSAIAEALEDAARRVVTRVGHQARKAAGDDNRYRAWLDSGISANAAAALEMLSPSLKLVASLGPAHSGVAHLLASIQSQLKLAFDTGAPLEAKLQELESMLPQAFARENLP